MPVPTVYIFNCGPFSSILVHIGLPAIAGQSHGEGGAGGGGGAD